MPGIRSKSRLAVVVALGVGLLAGMGSGAAFGARFGTACQEEYQNNWQNELHYQWERCSAFNSELDDTDTKVFYYNLHGAKWWWENGGDQLAPEVVALFYAGTHGGAWGNRSVWAMWDQNQLADSSNMRLGDEANQLSLFFTYACETLKFSDGNLWTRMGPIMRGGVRFAGGSHGTLWDGITTDETGEDFADNLQHQHTLKYSWKDGNSDWATEQDVAVMATGTNSANCAARRDNMTWQNHGSYPRLRDGQIGYYCYTYWTNL